MQDKKSNNSSREWRYNLPPNPNTESKEAIEQYEKSEAVRRALLIAQGYTEILPE